MIRIPAVLLVLGLGLGLGLAACSGETVECSDCDGSGVITTTSRTEKVDPGKRYEMKRSTRAETCPECDGTGKVTRD